MTSMTEPLEQTLRRYMNGKTVLLGIGNPLRGDDAVGTLLAEKFLDNEFIVGIPAGEVPENYTGVIRNENPQTIILADAIDFMGEPGQVVLVEEIQLEERFSSHRPSLGLLMHYLRMELGATVLLLGIQPENTDYDSEMSHRVKETKSQLEKMFKNLSKPGKVA
jgi:hydrogenase 3 maturation protease